MHLLFCKCKQTQNTLHVINTIVNNKYPLQPSIKMLLGDEFDLSTTVATFARNPAELIEDISLTDVEQLLDNLTDVLAVSPSMINESSNLGSIYYLLSAYNDLDDKSRERLVDIILSGLTTTTQDVQTIISNGETALFKEHKIQLEVYSFLLHWYLIQTEAITVKTLANTRLANTRSGKKSSGDKEAENHLVGILVACFDAITNCLKLSLESISETSSERDVLCGLYLKPIYLFMESDFLIKNNKLKLYMFKAICLAVKTQHQQAAVETSLMQLLTYFEHLPEPLAELAQILYEQYDHFQITEGMIKELSMKQFNSNDSKAPKVIATYLITISQLAPSLLMKNLSRVIKLLESESFTIRCAVIESAGNVLIHEANQGLDEGDSERAMSQINGLLELISERALDVNPFCRCKVLQTFSSVCELDIKLTSHRPMMTTIAVNAIQDKSGHVRRNAIKLLSRLISTHPFGQLHGSQLRLSEWEERLAAVNKEINNVFPASKRDRKSLANDQSVLDLEEPTTVENQSEENNDSHMEGSHLEDAESNQNGNTSAGSDEAEEEDAPPASEVSDELINRLQLTQKYYKEAIEFITKIHVGLQCAELLLFSKNKLEVIDSMDFFVLADAYDIEPARQGIRKMIRLVWSKANNDEQNAIQSHLITCYQSLFFDSPAGLTESEANLVISRNIISLTYGASLAELASLEHLLVLAVEKELLVSRGLIKTLWKIYGYPQNISKSQRRGAIILLGMIAKADSTVATSGMDIILNIGLGERGLEDLGLAKYSCIALQRCVTKDEWKRLPTSNEENSRSNRVPSNHDAIYKLAAFLLSVGDSMEWFGVAEQAVKAINDLCETPSVVFTEIIKVKSRQVFGKSDDIPDRQFGLAQLLFIVGEVALKTMVYLERCEALFKRAKIAAEKAQATLKSEQASSKEEEDDIEMVGGGTTEDDFTEAISYIRERELLFGAKSLLARFGPLVSELCKSGLKTKQSEAVSVASTLCLSKLMCVSAEYCEQNMSTLLSLIENSNSSTIRSNCVLALGDIAVCFNNILDDNTDALYSRLHDDKLVVQRTCLMTLTFLILAGQVKVKGQLGEMAKCLEDDDKDISDLARMFFSELATKDNAIYNGFIDMFSMLAVDQDLSEESLHKIFKFLVSFIDKDKQVKQLSEKLYNRLDKCETEKAWNDVAYVLGLLPHKNEDIAKTIGEGFKYAVKVE